MQRFEQECAFLESIRHPNIVQYLGTTRDPESRLPVLLMELLDESLTKMLEHSPTAFPYFVEVDICHDIALAVAYLHSNDIIHRDLSSNNVLVVAKRRAKVTDFGMSRISGTAPTMTPLTMCPGTLAYMSPEALEEPPTYTKKLDCFSEGVMMIQVCTRLWPEPGPRTKTVLDPRSPTGTTRMPVLEPERRQKHIDKINRRHGLLLIAMDCLCYHENERPSSEALCERLAGLKETREYRESMEQVDRDQNNMAELERQIGEMQMRETATIQQLQTAERQLQQERNGIAELERQIEEMQMRETTTIQRLQTVERQLQQERNGIAELERQRGKMQMRETATIQRLQTAERQLQQQGQLQSQIQTLSHQLEEREEHYRSQIELVNRQLQSKNRQLEEQEQVTAEIQQANHSLQGEVEQLQQQLSQQTRPNTKSSQPPPPLAHEAQKSYPPKRKVMLHVREWKGGEKAPMKMCRGTAVVDGNVAYFMRRTGQTYCYNKRWSELPQCPYWYSSLAVIRGLPTAIGGHSSHCGGYQYQNKLLSIVDKKWVEHFPSMSTKRSNTTTVATQHHLIVAGGWDGSNHLNTVEVMDIQTLVWSTAASLRHPYSRASAAICGDQLYMLGGVNNDFPTKSVLTCSLTSLLQSRSETSPRSVWNSISDAPMYHSTCVAVDGELLSVGGRDEQLKATSAVYKYDPTADSWLLISNMSTSRDHCLVAVLPTNEMMVVGGFTSVLTTTDKVEIANIL